MFLVDVRVPALFKVSMTVYSSRRSDLHSGCDEVTVIPCSILGYNDVLTCNKCPKFRRDERPRLLNPAS